MGKEKLAQACQLLCGRSLTKGEIVYECQRDEQGQFAASVTLSPVDPSIAYHGQPAMNQKQAEINAAEAALQELHDHIVLAEEAAQERKAAKAKERAEMLEAKHEAEIIKR